jgi:hypothetical protein
MERGGRRAARTTWDEMPHTPINRSLDLHPSSSSLGTRYPPGKNATEMMVRPTRATTLLISTCLETGLGRAPTTSHPIRDNRDSVVVSGAHHPLPARETWNRQHRDFPTWTPRELFHKAGTLRSLVHMPSTDRGGRGGYKEDEDTSSKSHSKLVMELRGGLSEKRPNTPIPLHLAKGLFHQRASKGLKTKKCNERESGGVSTGRPTCKARGLVGVSVGKCVSVRVC